MKTEVGIIGAGPAGLMLARILQQHGIDTIILERRSRDHVLGRIRAGVLEQGTVDTLKAHGVGARLEREGIPIKSMQIRWNGEKHVTSIVDESGHRVADGEPGELIVSGPSAAEGYWNQREKSRRTFRGEWTHTGDTYTRDAEGYYRYNGRSDDMLKVGGIWVSPFEVESALAAHPAVLEAAVVGAEDGDGLVKPKAFVVLQPGGAAGSELVEELKGFVKERLAPFKYPRWIEIVSELPKTATGKIQRFKLRR